MKMKINVVTCPHPRHTVDPRAAGEKAPHMHQCPCQGWSSWWNVVSISLATIRIYECISKACSTIAKSIASNDNLCVLYHRSFHHYDNEFDLRSRYLGCDSYQYGDSCLPQFGRESSKKEAGETPAWHFALSSVIPGTPLSFFILKLRLPWSRVFLKWWQTNRFYWGCSEKNRFFL